jgi:hypothetical protein
MPGRTPTIPDPDDVEGASRDVIGLFDSEEGRPTFVLADLTADERWLSVPAEVALSVEEWR